MALCQRKTCRGKESLEAFRVLSYRCDNHSNYRSNTRSMHRCSFEEIDSRSENVRNRLEPVLRSSIPKAARTIAAPDQHSPDRAELALGPTPAPLIET